MPSGTTPNSAEILPVLTNYFAFWSAGDLAGYRALFHENASIVQVTDGEVYRLNLDEFIDQQTPDPRARRRRWERMTSCIIEEDAVVAVVAAGYELDCGYGLCTGMDRFTLMRDNTGQWKIICLLWYGFQTAA